MPEDEGPISIEGGDEPVSLDSEPISLEAGAEGPSAIRQSAGAREAVDTFEFKRPLQTPGTGASRFKLGRSKISVPALEGLEKQINTFLESDEIDVKYVGHVIGGVQGKTLEDNLFVMVWY